MQIFFTTWRVYSTLNKKKPFHDEYTRRKQGINKTLISIWLNLNRCKYYFCLHRYKYNQIKTSQEDYNIPVYTYMRMFILIYKLIVFCAEASMTMPQKILMF